MSKKIKYSKCPQCRTSFKKTDIVIEDAKNRLIKKLDIYKRTRNKTKNERCEEVYNEIRLLLNEVEKGELKEEKIQSAINVFKYIYKNKWFLKSDAVKGMVSQEGNLFKAIIRNKLNEFIKIDKRFNEWDYKLRNNLK